MIQNKSNIAILILAAGRSSRMGVPKQLLPWKKTTLIEHSIKTALEVNPNIFVVLGANAELIQSKIQVHPIKIILNHHWENGLGSSIACSINYLQELEVNLDGVLIMLADQPLIDQVHIKKLIKEFLSGHSIVTTSYSEIKEGVPAIFDVKYFDKLSELKDDIGAKLLIKKNKTLAINGYNKIIDIDTKEDYHKIISKEK